MCGALLSLSVLMLSCSQEITTDLSSSTLLPQSDTPLIEKVTTGGFRPYPQTTTLTLHRSGEMTKKVWTGTTDPADPGTSENSSLGKLDMSIVRFATLNADSLVTGTLQFDPSTPICADAPVSTYTAYSQKTAGIEAIVFMKKEECVEKKLTSGEAANLSRLALAIDALANSN